MGTVTGDRALGCIAAPIRLLRASFSALLCSVLPVALCALQLAPGSVAAQPPAESGAPKENYVLVLTGTPPYTPAFTVIDQGMQAAVARGYARPVTFLFETLDTVRFDLAIDRLTLAQLIAKKYENLRPRALMLVTESAVDLYLDHLQSLWPGVPAIYHSVPRDVAQRRYANRGLAGIASDSDFEQTLRIAFALQPKARRLLIVGGVSEFDQRELAQARQALRPYAGRVQIDYLIGLSPEALAERVAREDRDAIVLYVSLLRDQRGLVYTPVDVLERLSGASAAPVYGAWESFMGRGIVAGGIESLWSRGERAGEMLVHALQAPTPLAPVTSGPIEAVCMADARQLERFGLRAGLLPDGCELRFSEPGWFQRFWWQSLLVLAALLGQSALIVSLLLQRRRRHAAELKLQAQRVQLLHASRLAVAGELTASIAHEINQPLGAILSNADAAQILVEAGKMERGELLHILADIKRDDLRASDVIKRLRALLARHETERRSIDLNRVVEDAAAILRHEAGRRGVAIEYALDASPADVIGDAVQLQQVIINLILNAFDACVDLPDGARRVRVVTSNTPNGVQISVRDFGAGIALADLPSVFDAFYTTKGGGMGLGLSIARSIVEAHGGSISAASCDVGAEFRVILPLAPVTDVPEQRAGDTT